MSRAALYARYSSDNQREASIEDQFRLCWEYAQREQWQIVGSYEDAAISGASTILRPGIQRLMRGMESSMFCWRRRWTGSAAIRRTLPRCTSI